MDEHPEQLLVRFRLYTLIGIAVLMTNSVVVAVFLSSREIRKKFILFNFLAVADIVSEKVEVELAGERRLLHRHGSRPRASPRRRPFLRDDDSP